MQRLTGLLSSNDDDDALQIRTDGISFAGLPHPRVYGCRYGTEDLMSPHAQASSRRGYNPDGSGGNGPFTGGSIVDGVMPVPSPSHPRARACHRACAAGRWRGHPV
ncbi:hypothetical protein EVAR_60533_1 [Eumeta japonica]|uniref:Uncharacterized protein n=1 Tax=Eumeta variegata TaxID=151549 RepID=A0A4C1YQH9_EUMVA|nr:hypothetical protein EVAR_60533_1 [Eumeta japonica]